MDISQIICGSQRKKLLEFPNSKDLLENLLDNIDLQTAREAFFSSLPNTI